MASKTSATKSPSKDKKRTSSTGTSRKTLRRTTAAYARKIDDDDDDDDQGKKSAGGEAGGDTEGRQDAPATSARSAQPAPGAEETAWPAMAGAPAAREESPGAAEQGRAPEPPPAATAAREASPAAAEPHRAPEPPLDVLDDAAPAVAEQASPPPAMESEFAELFPPDAIGDRDPGSPAPPPGKAPPGDSRSLRRYHEGVEEFVLIYRYESYLITRAGKVGTQGTWTKVEYPHIGAAAHAYAQECSNLTGAGYRDVR